MKYYPRHSNPVFPPTFCYDGQTSVHYEANRRQHTTWPSTMWQAIPGTHRVSEPSLDTTHAPASRCLRNNSIGGVTIRCVGITNNCQHISSPLARLRDYGCRHSRGSMGYSTIYIDAFTHTIRGAGGIPDHRWVAVRGAFREQALSLGSSYKRHAGW